MNEPFLKNNDIDVLVLFSGGADSALSALRAIESCNSVLLLTLNQGGGFFLKRTAILANRLENKFEEKKVIHSIVDNRALHKELLKTHRINYCKSIGLSLFSQRAAMYIRALLLCLEYHIPSVYDGTNRKQSAFAPPQKREASALIKEFFKSFNITYETPIYEYDELSEKILLKQGLIQQHELYQAHTVFYRKDSFLICDVFSFLKRTLNNKIHPVFIVESFLQLLGRITSNKRWSEEKRKIHFAKALDYFTKALSWGKKYAKEKVIT